MMRRFFAAFLSALVLATSPAYAGFLVNSYNFGAAALDPFSLAFTTSTQTGTDNTTTTFTTQNVGTDVTGSNIRYTVVGAAGFTGGASTTISSMTICGISATAIVQAASNQMPTGIYIANTSGQGTSCSIAITYGGAVQTNGIGVYRLINPTSSTAFGSGCVTTASSGVVTLDVNINTGGAAVGVTGDSNGTSAATHTWSGLSEQYDVAMESRTTHSGASGGSAGTPTAITSTASVSPTAGRVAGCSASWSP